MKGRKITGGKYHKLRKKKKHSLPKEERKIRVGETRKKTIRTRGGANKKVLLREEFINAIDPKTKKSKKVKIKNVLETPADRFLARQNVLIKGAKIETEIGNVQITNRPSKEGTIQGILLKE